MTARPSAEPPVPVHPRFVRVGHWLSALAVAALLLTGVEVMLSHPRYYWGEVGNVNTTPLFTLPLPASRSSVPTGFSYTLPDQNGWSRYLHFQAAWLFLFAGAAYLLLGAVRGHFRRRLVPSASERSWAALRRAITAHLRPVQGGAVAPGRYNTLQQLSYLLVVFVLLPLMVWTGLAMSPAWASVFPGSVALLGGRQSARTLHFLATIALTLFIVVHVAMVARAGWKVQLRAMFTGHPEGGS